jgi:hypothetical protein
MSGSGRVDYDSFMALETSSAESMSVLASIISSFEPLQCVSAPGSEDGIMAARLARRSKYVTPMLDDNTAMTRATFTMSSCQASESKIATARVHPAEARRILKGKQLTVKPNGGSDSRLWSFSK